MGYILIASTKATCPHAAPINNTTNYARDPLIDGHTIWTKDDKYVVSGCPIGEKRCIDVDWAMASPSITVDSVPVLTSDSIPNCRGPHMLPNGRGVLLSYQTEHTDGE